MSQSHSETNPHEVPACSADPQRVREDFAELLPTVTRLARRQHQRLRGEAKEDAVAETVARAWHSYQAKALTGEDPAPLLGGMVHFAARHVRAGKLLGRSEARNDALGRTARASGGYQVVALPHSEDQEVASEACDALRHRAAGPAEEAICKVDYQAWLEGLSEKQREVAEGLASGLNPSEIARIKGVSKASVQQIQATLGRKWDEFHGKAEFHGQAVGR